jgi:hypothetical protein
MNAPRPVFLIALAAVIAAGAARPSPGRGRAAAWPPEISGAARLPDGRLLLVDDETRDAVFVWNGRPGEEPVRIALSISLDDLEGAAADSTGLVYLLTSHSLTRSGKLRADRQRIARLRVVGESATGVEVAADLRAALGLLLTGDEAHPGVPLNLEGLAWYPQGDALLLGVRAPLRSGRALVVGLRPAGGLFDPSRPAGDLGPLHPTVAALDLGGRGVRSLEFDPWRRAILILAGPAADGHEGSAIYLWTPGETRSQLLRVPGLGEIRQPEGVVVLGPPGPDGASPICVIGEGGAPVHLTARP